jgi:hypothetical protein
MADKSIREQILDAIITRLQTILKTNDYVTNLGQYIYHFLQTDQELDKLPSINMRDITDTIESYTTRMYDNKIALELHVKASSGATTIQTIYDLIKDVYSAINVDDTWGNLALDTQSLGNEIVMDQQGQIIGGVIIRIEIEYEAEKWTF